MLITMSVLASHFDLRVVNKSPHHSVLYRPVEYTMMRIAGHDNFLPLSYEIEQRSLTKKGLVIHDKARFIPEDFDTMSASLRQGKTVMIAAHNQTAEWQLPPRAGYGFVYLAESVPGSIVLPVTVDIRAEKPAGIVDVLTDGPISEKIAYFFRRPDAHMHIHKPFTIQQMPGYYRFRELAARQASLSEEERQEFIALRERRREQGEQIMKTLASALPPGKRGRWQEQ
jgi:hypothetical protein